MIVTILAPSDATHTKLLHIIAKKDEMISRKYEHIMKLNDQILDSINKGWSRRNNNYHPRF